MPLKGLNYITIMQPLYFERLLHGNVELKSIDKILGRSIKGKDMNKPPVFWMGLGHKINLHIMTYIFKSNEIVS